MWESAKCYEGKKKNSKAKKKVLEFRTVEKKEAK